MGNILQRFIYNFSSIAPLCLIFAVVYYLQKSNWAISVIFVLIAIFLTIIMVSSFLYGKKHLVSINIRTSDISPNDGWIVVYIISYMLPFANMIVEDFNLIICGIIAFALIIIVPYVNSAMPNPLLFFRGYHFYLVSAENGVSGYILISKRNLRKKQDLKKVKRIFEFLLLDVEV